MLYDILQFFQDFLHILLPQEHYVYLAYVGELGKNVGLDPTKLIKAVKEGQFRKKLLKDAEVAHKLGINSTPTFIINDQYKIVGAQPIEEFRNILGKVSE